MKILRYLKMLLEVARVSIPLAGQEVVSERDILNPTYFFPMRDFLALIETLGNQFKICKWYVSLMLLKNIGCYFRSLIFSNIFYTELHGDFFHYLVCCNRGVKYD